MAQTTTVKKTYKVTFKVVELNKPSATAIENLNKAIAELILTKTM